MKFASQVPAQTRPPGETVTIELLLEEKVILVLETAAPLVSTTVAETPATLPTSSETWLTLKTILLGAGGLELPPPQPMFKPARIMIDRRRQTADRRMHPPRRTGLQVTADSSARDWGNTECRSWGIFRQVERPSAGATW